MGHEGEVNFEEKLVKWLVKFRCIHCKFILILLEQWLFLGTFYPLLYVIDTETNMDGPGREKETRLALGETQISVIHR